MANDGDPCAVLPLHIFSCLPLGGTFTPYFPHCISAVHVTKPTKCLIHTCMLGGEHDVSEHLCRTRARFNGCQQKL